VHIHSHWEKASLSPKEKLPQQWVCRQLGWSLGQCWGTSNNPDPKQLSFPSHQREAPRGWIPAFILLSCFDI
jgi:hypothetical protein